MARSVQTSPVPVFRASTSGNLARKRWFAVQTQPCKEGIALSHLGNQNFETFCPFRRMVRRSGKRSVTLLEPFFPSYVFVRLDLSRQRWRSINGTIGVARLVSFGSEPTPLPDGLIERLQRLRGADGELTFDEELRAGQRVRIMGGPLDAVCGLLETTKPRKRVMVLLELISGATRTEVPRDRLVGA